MEFEFDSSKNEGNIAKHGIALTVAVDFEFATAKISRDTRRDYGEDRSVAYGFIADGLYAFVFTMRGEKMRLISLRKANQEERDRHHGQT